MAETDKSQLDRFKEAARELETDDDEARLNERLRKLAKQRARHQGNFNRADRKSDEPEGEGDA